MVFEQALRLAAAIDLDPKSDSCRTTMDRRAFIPAPNVDIGLAGPKMSGGVSFTFAKIQPMVQDDQIRAVFPAILKHFNKSILFLRAQLPANGIDLEEVEVKIAAQFDKHLCSGLFMLRGVTEAIWTEPDTEPTPEGLCLLGKRTKAVWELLLEAVRIHAAIPAGSVDGTGVQRINVQIHSVVIMEPFKKLQIREGLLLGGTFVRIIDPREIMAERRG